MFTRTTVCQPKKVDSLEYGKIVLNATYKNVGKLLNGTFNFVGSIGAEQKKDDY